MDTTRLTLLKKLLTQKGLDGVLISSVPDIIYLTNFDHFAADEREAFLLIAKKNNYILTDKRYTLAVQKHVKNFTLCEIAYMHGFEEWIKVLTKKENVQSLGIAENNITVAESKKIIPYVKTIKHVDLSELRIKKSLTELINLQKACDIGDKAFSYLLTQLKPGMTEKEIALLIESFVKKHHAEMSFATIVAIEDNAAHIHHKTGNKKLAMNNLILLDFGVRYENYCSDMSRTIFFGKSSPEQKKAYQTVLAAQQQAIAYIEDSLRTGKTIKGADVDKTSRDFIIKKGYASFAHSLGHGIGLEVHERPSLGPNATSLIDDMMVFSLEPGIYLADTFGIRIEDLFAIKNGQLIQLTKSPRELIELSSNEAKI